jgi:ubiquitin-protein ligase
MKKDNMSDLWGEITGPPDTPYEKAKFALDITIPDSYPFNPPKVKLGLLLYSVQSTFSSIAMHDY